MTGRFAISLSILLSAGSLSAANQGRAGAAATDEVLATQEQGAGHDELLEVDGLTIRPIRHGTLALQYEQQTIVVDPVANGDYDGLTEITAILITDVHSDHWDLTSAAMLMGVNTKVIGPEAVADEWGGIDTVLQNGEVAVVDQITIEAVPMYNLERGPSADQLYHPLGRGNGYVVTIGGKRVYISGDTECTPEMRVLEEIDIAFVCMNLPYTMGPAEAAECVKAFRPAIVYPYHFRGSDLDVFTWRMQETPEVEVRILDWYPRR